MLQNQHFILTIKLVNIIVNRKCSYKIIPCVKKGFCLIVCCDNIFLKGWQEIKITLGANFKFKRSLRLGWDSPRLNLCYLFYMKKFARRKIFGRFWWISAQINIILCAIGFTSVSVLLFFPETQLIKHFTFVTKLRSYIVGSRGASQLGGIF